MNPKYVLKPSLFLLGLLITLMFSACDESQHSKGNSHATKLSPSEHLVSFLDSIFDAAVYRDPQWQSRQGIRKDYGKWSNITDTFQDKELAIRQNELETMINRFDLEKLDAQAKLSFRMFEEKVKMMAKSARFRYHTYPVNQMHGLHAEMPSFLINVHRIDSLSDAEAYISRLKGLHNQMHHLIRKLKVREEKGIIPPKFVFPQVIQDCRNLISGYPFDESKEKAALYADFEEKLDGLKDLSEGKREELLDEATKVFKKHVHGGYTNLINYLLQLEKKADSRDGAWKLPDGADFYTFALQRTTTTDMRPEEIHQKGLDEVARIHEEMRTIKEKVGFEGDLRAFFTFMRTDPQFYFPNTPEGRKAYLDKATGIIDTMRGHLPKLFITQPKARLIVKRVEAYREKSAGKAFYNQPAPDGSRPGTYYANLYNMADMPTYQMEALAYHEAIPGHHMQLSIAMELDGIAKFRKFEHFTAYVEGWALYTEFIPREMGFYADPYSDFGRLAMELWRACRLVVDTGIHWKKWTREEAIDYLKKNTPNPEGDIVKAIERYIVMPSQATAYKIGMLKIQELRKKAEDALAEGFDIRSFHEEILTNGAVPLNILEELIDAWIAESNENT